MTPSENNTEYDIRISIEEDLISIEPDRIQILIQNILSYFKIPTASVDIAVVDDQAITDIHTQYLKEAKTTDVISFDLSDHPQISRCFEIIVNAQQAQRQAAERRHPPQAELALYIVHGLLHNLGYDDATDPQARRMHQMEDQLLEQNGYKPVFYRSIQ